MKASFIITIEARMDSSRLYGKVLKNLGNNYSSLKLIINRLKIFKLNKKIIVVTSEKESNDSIKKLCDKLGVSCFRGSESNVLERLYLGTKSFTENSIIQLTADNPLIDIALIKFMISYYIKNYPRIDFLTNNNLFEKTFSSPLGMKLSIIKKKSLESVYKLVKKTKKRDLKEYPTLFFYREGKKKFVNINIIVPPKWRIPGDPRLTLDTKQDLRLIRKIFKKLKFKENFGITEIKKILLDNPKLIKINKSVKQKLPSL
jgi:spore coat polysaccharide biosynthesis protein SpsF